MLRRVLLCRFTIIIGAVIILCIRILVFIYSFDLDEVFLRVCSGCSGSHLTPTESRTFFQPS